MKSFDNFFSEATEDDLRKMGASDSAVAELKRRQAERAKKGIDKGFSTGDDRAEKKKKDKEPSAITKAQKALPAAPGTQSAPKKDVTAGIARTNPSSSRTGKEAVGAPKVAPKPAPKPDPNKGSKTYDRITPERKKGGPLMAPDEARMRREREINKKLDKEEKRKSRLGRMAKGAAKKTGKAAMGALSKAGQMGKAGEVGVAAGEDLEGLTGRDSGLIS